MWKAGAGWMRNGEENEGVRSLLRSLGEGDDLDFIAKRKAT